MVNKDMSPRVLEQQVLEKSCAVLITAPELLPGSKRGRVSDGETSSDYKTKVAIFCMVFWTSV